jgi:DNA-binding NtrC family response regulator
VLVVAEPGLDVPDIAADLHDRARSLGAFVRLDCAAEPPAVERALFGAPAGGGDVEAIDRASALARAAGGTLFVGDVTKLSAGAQARLARIARDGEASVEGVRQPIDLRLIASAGPELESEMGEGRLRRDLVRHLSHVRIDVPPLRERGGDIVTLVDHLVVRSCAENGVAVKGVTQPAMTLLTAMPWRGNLAELRSAVERMVATVESSAIQLEDVLQQVRFDGRLVANAPVGSLRAARQQFERDYVTLVLRHHQWRVSEAARTLGMQRTNLYRKARQLGIRVARPGDRA